MCDITEGMSDSLIIPDTAITGSQPGVINIRPSGRPGWTPSVPKDNSEKPFVIIDLNSVNADPVPLSDIVVKGNVESVTVEFSKTGSFKIKLIWNITLN